MKDSYHTEYLQMGPELSHRKQPITLIRKEAVEEIAKLAEEKIAVFKNDLKA